MARNPLLDITFNCLGYDRFGVPRQGVLVFSPTISGILKTISISNSTLSFNVSISATFTVSVPQSGDALDFGSGISISGIFIVTPSKFARVKWSGIGEFNFDIDRKNLAGNMPLGWLGEVWQILKLGPNVIVYGSGGITKLIPKGSAYGNLLLSSIGIISEGSAVATEEGHFYINQKGQLCKIFNDLEILGYEEFLSLMSSPIMLYDNLDKLLYICDGTLGYVYSTQYNSLGQGPIMLTGISYSNIGKIIVGSETIIMPGIEFTTDILDFGSRAKKTIKRVEIGTNLTSGLEIKIYTRINIDSDFISTDWISVTPSGVAYIPCYGEEFKIGIKSLEYVPFGIDYLRIIGIIHGFNQLDLEM